MRNFRRWGRRCAAGLTASLTVLAVAALAGGLRLDSTTDQHRPQQVTR